MPHRTVWLVLAWLLVLGLPAAAQELADANTARHPRFLLAKGTTTVPLDVAGTPVLMQRLALDLDGVSLRDALKAITSRTRLRLVYNDDVVPLETRVHLKADDIAVGPALMDLLLDTGIDVVFHPDGHAVLVKRTAGEAPLQTGTIVGRVTDVKTQGALAGATVIVEGTRLGATTGSDGRYRVAQVPAGTYTVRARYIGYAPATASVSVTAEQEATTDFGLEKSAQRLDEVVTTGTVVPTEVKALPTPISIVTAEDIEQQNMRRVDQVFRGQVPGAVAFDQGAGANYFSIVHVRGGSTLSDNPAIKTFVDGVELADPTWLTMIDPSSIDRIEITRGPQASTLYGAGALNGVMQIFSKKGQLGFSRPEVTARVSVGGVGGLEGMNTAVATDNALSVLGGDAKTSYSVGGSYRHQGQSVPQYKPTDWSVFAGGQTTQGPLTLSGTARYADKTFDAPWDTRFQSYTFFSRPPYQAYYSRQQTYGLTANLQAVPGWQHTVTLGYDQNYFGFNQTQPRLTTPVDSLLQTFSQHRAKISLLYHSDLSLRFGAAAAAVITGGVNYDSFDDLLSITSDATRTTGGLDGTTVLLRNPWTNTGYFAQAQVSLAGQLFVTGGLRAEQNHNFGVDYGTAWSPRLGASYVRSLGPASVKLRGSYGESIRAPLPGERDAQEFSFARYLANPNLAPERQTGFDAGVDIYIGRLSLGATYYSQRVVDLIDLASVGSSADSIPTFQYQNVNRVKNRGWEFEAHVPFRSVTFSGTYSIAHSTIEGLAAGYGGDYQVGDQLLQVPRTSAGATVTLSPLKRTTVTGSVTYIGHWTSLDGIALYQFLYGGQPYRGSQRAYWVQYPTVTKIALGMSQEMAKGVTAFVRVDNVGNNLRFESINTNLPTPRTATVGANVRY
jgi:outer membrane receptor protein involved in Fe transport